MNRPNTAPPRCAACGAPALAGRTECWSCGSSLSAPPPVPPPAIPTQVSPPAVGALFPPSAPAAQGAPLFDCPQCRRTVAVFQTKCPHCGFPLGPLAPGVPGGAGSGLPTDWEEIPQPDGTVLVKRSKTGSSRRVMFGLGAALVFVMYVLSEVAPRGYRPSDPIGAGLEAFVFLLGALMIGAWAVWMAMLEEDWSLGPDLLIVRRRLVGREWSRTHRMATVLFERYRRLLDFSLYRKLISGSWDSTWYVSLYYGAGSTVGLVGGIYRAEELQALAHYIAGRTGWPLREDEYNIWTRPFGGLHRTDDFGMFT